MTKLPLEFIPIEDDGYHLIIEGKINGNKVRLLVDTGASRSVFDHDRIKEALNLESLELKETDKLSTGISSNAIKSHYTKFKSLEFGELLIKDYKAVILEMSHVNKSYQELDLQPIDGVIGSDILKKYDAVIDYGLEVLVLRLRPA